MSSFILYAVFCMLPVVLAVFGVVLETLDYAVDVCFTPTSIIMLVTALSLFAFLRFYLGIPF